MIPKRFFKNILEYALFLLLATTVRTMPRIPALNLGRRLGELSRHVLPKKVKIARENLRAAFPEKPAEDIEQLILEVFRHLGVSGVEMLRIDLFKGQKDLDTYFSFSGLEHLRQAYDQGKGVILLTGHVGFWEVGTFFMPHLGFPVDFVAKRMKNPYVDRYFLRLREAAGGRCLESRRGARKIVRSLSEKRGIAILLDQHTRPQEAVCVDFFNRPAYTTPIITQIAMKYDVPVVPVFVYRTADFHYQVIAEPAVCLDSAPGEEAVVKNTALLTNIIEQAVRKDLSQWFWVHRRWRVKPTPSTK